MSKQSSLHPDENEIVGTKSTISKKAKKPVILWQRRTKKYLWQSKFHPAVEPKWHKHGRYRTKEIAEKVIIQQNRQWHGIMDGFYEYKIEDPNDGV